MKRGKQYSSNLLKRVVTLASFTILGIYSGMTGCGGSGGGDSAVAAQSITTSLGEMNPGSVASIPFGSAGSAKVTFSNLTGREQFVVALQAHTTSAGTYNADISGSESVAGSLQTSLSDNAHLPLMDSTSNDPMEATAAFHEMLRNDEANLPAMPHSDSLRASMSTGGGSLRESSVGEVLSVRVLNSLSSTGSTTTIGCRVRLVTSHFIACRDTRDDDLLSDDNLDTLMNRFESTANAEYSTYGNVSDVDQNGKVVVVYTHELNGLGGGGGIVTGYFYAGDLNGGNNGEYIFCHVPDDNGQHGVAIPTSFYMSNTGPNCMPHELQHAINYNMRVFENGTSSEPGPYNEGLSHLAEHLYGFNNENPSRVSLYFGSNLASFTGGTSLAQRGGSYLFYRYLYEQANNGRFSRVRGGDNFLQQLLNSSRTGLDDVANVSGEDINTILNDFFTSLYLSNTGLSSDSRYNFTGINLRSTQDDNRGTVLNGPTTNSASSIPFSTAVLATSSSYILVTGSQIQANGNTMSLDASIASDPGASLIRIADR